MLGRAQSNPENHRVMMLSWCRERWNENESIDKETYGKAGQQHGYKWKKEKSDMGE
jgi:hypothetical protein